MAVSLWRDAKADETPRTVAEALALRDRAANYWNRLDLPYDRLQVPDEGIQGVIEASLRGIYQNRDYKNGVPVYQVGPTCYRDLSCADGSFLCELGVLLGRAKDASDTLDYLLSFQCANGRVWVYWDYWKESGLMLWSVVRYAELTGDAAWLKSRWRRVEGMVAFIEELRRRAKRCPAAPNYGLIPDGFGDGAPAFAPNTAMSSGTSWACGPRSPGPGCWGRTSKPPPGSGKPTTWTAISCAAARRDARKDQHGNLYLPNVMGSDGRIPPPRGQWAFVQGIYPGKLYRRDDPLAKAALPCSKRRRSRACRSTPVGSMAGFGLTSATGLPTPGFGSARKKSAPILYDVANHASPLLAWWEEQMPKGKGDRLGGDMPHNWGSAEFIRQVRAHAGAWSAGRNCTSSRDFPRPGPAQAWSRESAASRRNSAPCRSRSASPPTADERFWNWTCRNGFALGGRWRTWTAGPAAPARSICPRKAACGARSS